MAGFDLNSLLNGKSKGAAGQKQETAVAGQGPAEGQKNGFEVVMLDVEDLMPSKDNFYATEGINELADAIELSGGIEQNLIVKPEAHGKYEVIAGHRRRLAALKLIGEGKEEYRKVPCRIKHESDTIKDKLSLILTNATARELTDWEKVQQAKQLKELLTEYKKALTEENKDKPKEERVRMGRIREIVAQMLNTSTTQIGRMEAIENNLSPEFKQELEKGNIGMAFTYNEPLVGWEYVLDTAKLVKDAGMKNVIVTNGTASPEILEKLLPYIDAMNIDLKGFSEEYYRKLGGSFTAVKEFIVQAAANCHVELTTLIVPGENDSVREMEEEAAWIASVDREIPLHVSRFFPRYQMREIEATAVKKVYTLAETAGKYLKYVYTGNC